LKQRHRERAHTQKKKGAKKKYFVDGEKENKAKNSEKKSYG
jgi:hypothetical protein